MQFHFEKTLEKRFEPQNQVADGTPAWRVLWLAKALRDWFGQPHRTFYQSGSCQVQFGYEALSFPVSDFASFFGAMVGGIGRVWPVQVFGLGDGNELVELSVIEDNGTFALRQRSISGVWQDELQDLYLHIQLPSPHSASGVFRLLNALEKGAPAAALEWDYGEFLEGQGLSQTDHTTSFCYVFLEDDWDQEDTVGYLAGLTEAQKSDLWRRFLQDHLHPPEFEWLRDALIRDCSGGDEYLIHPEAIRKLENCKDDKSVLKQLEAIKQENKRRFASYLARESGAAEALALLLEQQRDEAPRGLDKTFDL